MEKYKGVCEKWNRYKYVLVVVLAGMVLLLWPTGRAAPSVQERSAPAAAELQREMEQALSQIAGVGQVRVLLTLDTDGERVLAQDTRVTYSGDADRPEKYEKTSEIILKDGGGGDETVIVRTAYPVYRGALVVCQGGARPEVRLTVTEAVSALTGLSSDRISVAEWQ